MKVKNIPTAAFVAHTNIANAGFVKVPNTQRLFSHPGFKGVLFKKVGNPQQAMAHGGIVFDRQDGHIVLVADPAPKRLGELRCAAATTLDFLLHPGPVIRRDTTEYYAIGATRPNAESVDVSVHTPSFAMAVVTPCFGVGVAKNAAKTFPNAASTAWSSYKGYNVSVMGGGNVITDTKPFLLLWREIPFVKSSRDFLLSAVDLVATRYPSNIRGEMHRALQQVAAGGGYDRPAALAICYLADDTGAEFLGHVPINAVVVKPPSGDAKPTVTIFRNAMPGDAITDSPDGKASMEGEHWFPFTAVDKTKYGVANPGKVKLAVSRPFSALRDSLKVSRDVTIDATKFIRDFTPLLDRGFPAGELNWSGVLADGLVSTYDESTTPKEHTVKMDAYATISAPGGPDLFTDLCNFATEAEAMVAKVTPNRCGVGAVFSTFDWSDMSRVRTPASMAVKGAVAVPKVAGGPDGYLVAGENGAMATITQTGMYRVTFVGQASEYRQVVIGGTTKAARSRPGKMVTSELKLFENTGIGFSLGPERSTGFDIRVKDVNFTWSNGPLKISGNSIGQLKMTNFVENDDPSAVFQLYADAPFTTATRSYGHAGTAVVAAGRACIFIEPMVDVQV